MVTQTEEQELERVKNQIDVYSKKINNERYRLMKINKEIADIETKVLAQQQQSRSETNEASIKKHISSLENQLNQSLIAFNTKVTTNKKLRHKIDELRQERVVYDEIYTKLEHRIQANAEAMKRVMEEGQTLIKKRDKAAKEVDAYRRQLNEAKESLQRDKEELASLKQDFKQEDERNFALAKQHEEVKHETAKQTSDSDIIPNIIQVKECDEEQALDEALTKIQELTGIDDADTIVEKLRRMDEVTHSIFNYIQELESETGMLDHEISEAQRELEILRCNDLTADAKMRQTRALAKERRAKLEQQIKDVDAQYQEGLEEWEKIKNSIETACSELEVSLPYHLDACGGVTENNVMEYLATIESKALAVIEGMKTDEDSENCSLASPSPIAKNVPSDMQNRKLTACMSLPTADDFAQASLDDDGDRPFAIQELQSSLLK